MNKMSTFIFFVLFLLSTPVDNAIALAAEEGKKETEKTFTFEEIVVTAPAETDTLTVETDPKLPRQPVPANDGGGYLKNIPGFSAVRKGGSGTDPTFRSLGGTRLNILLDGTYLQGGCGGRMDPPTAYIFPESYSKITVLKGPETVLYGGGNIAGTVLFERITPRFQKPGARVYSSLLTGSNGRNDELLDITSGDTKGYVRIIRSRSHADDYSDGSGNKVHSFYTRNSLTGIFGYTPDVNTLYEITADTSKAKAAYADRAMDGSKFDRNDYSFKFEKNNLSSHLNRITFNAYHNYIDHVMDNYSFRTPSGMAMASNPDRTTTGARLAVDLTLNPSTTAIVGIDYQKNEHTSRSGGKSYESKTRTPDMTFENVGIFGDIIHSIDKHSRLKGGLRMDSLDVKNENPSSLASDSNKTYGAFVRYEHDSTTSPLTTYFGIGHAERPADWWERNKTFSLKPEKNTQFDTGLVYQSGKLKSSLSLFYSKIDDFILLMNNKTTNKTSGTNSNATLYGGEGQVTYSLSDNWNAIATLAYVRGKNDTSGGPLPQIAPLEATLSLNYTKDKFGAGLLWRGVAAQKRVAVDSGNEIGFDIGPSAGFGILSSNLSYQPTKNLLISAGVDNIFDKTYAEFISKSVSSSMANLGLPVTVRVNEPGRTIWLKTSYSF
ncbi:Vitamin B12 transporter BtuB [Sporomusa silvacetica DSM 10669]|uniref:Vitamin B12 transporter BtuB n=1 Tax=Sporomusa silvacetica DSM 10669 TaxID=1123289 RepID=A0ABZ3IHY7_9FIRM|nr:TonB-dependent copper receptor [Sporomusa silvacetica]OZC17485.1 hemin receptor precursor [Sporomusa silvacetica DSM 10669]